MHIHIEQTDAIKRWKLILLYSSEVEVLSKLFKLQITLQLALFIAGFDTL